MKLCEYFLHEEFNKLVTVISSFSNASRVTCNKELFKFEIIKYPKDIIAEEHYSLRISSTSKRPSIWCIFFKEQNRAFVGFTYSNYQSYCQSNDPLYSVSVEEVAKFCEEFAPFEMKELLRNLLEAQL